MDLPVSFCPGAALLMRTSQAVLFSSWLFSYSPFCVKCSLRCYLSTLPVLLGVLIRLRSLRYLLDTVPCFPGSSRDVPALSGSILSYPLASRNPFLYFTLTHKAVVAGIRGKAPSCTAICSFKQHLRGNTGTGQNNRTVHYRADAQGTQGLCDTAADTVSAMRADMPISGTWDQRIDDNKRL